MKNYKFRKNKISNKVIAVIFVILAVVLLNNCAAIKSLSKISTATKAASTVPKTTKLITSVPKITKVPLNESVIKNIPKIQRLNDSPLLGLNKTEELKNEVPILINIPKNSEEFQNIHNFSPTTSQMSSVMKVNREISRNGNNVKKLERLKDIGDLTKDIEQKYIIFVGHNEEGRFMFVNGDKFEIAEISNTLSFNNKTPIFLSCNSQTYSDDLVGLTNQITYDEAYSVANKLSIYLKKNADNFKNLSREQLAEKIENLRFDYKLNVKIRNKAIFLTILATSSTEENKNKKRR